MLYNHVIQIRGAIRALVSCAEQTAKDLKLKEEHLDYDYSVEPRSSRAGGG
jgi:hypothetical protein